jgi:alcohol dehydrogenase (cytochrome c)
VSVRARFLTAVATVAAVVAVSAAGCAGRRPEYPLTERAVRFADLNEFKPGNAPPVADAVTGDRIARARTEPQNWLTYYGAYDGQRYSALDQITTATVRGLRPAWIFNYHLLGLYPAATNPAFEAAPLVVDGVMYVTGPHGYLWALDAETGKKLWQYQHQIPIDVALCCGNVNRGAAVARGKVYMATLNGYLVALDARTGSSSGRRPSPTCAPPRARRWRRWS